MNKKDNVWNYQVEEMVKGYAEEEYGYHCVFCESYFSKGRIYRSKDILRDAYNMDHKDEMAQETELFDAYGAIRKHVEEYHGNTADWLLKWDINVIGVSEIQRNILRLMSEGNSDREISLSAGIAESTVRNHRFKLREKEKQAKLFLALMKSLEQKTDRNIANSDKGVIEETHISAAMPDDRYTITEEERTKTIKTYMNENGAIRQFPAKEKKKIILLGEVMKNFKLDVRYTEAEINRVLKRIYEQDYPGIRRALIEYGLMERTADCSFYMVRG